MNASEKETNETRTSPLYRAGPQNVAKAHIKAFLQNRNFAKYKLRSFKIKRDYQHVLYLYPLIAL